MMARPRSERHCGKTRAIIFNRSTKTIIRFCCCFSVGIVETIMSWNSDSRQVRLLLLLLLLKNLISIIEGLNRQTL